MEFRRVLFRSALCRRPIRSVMLAVHFEQQRNELDDGSERRGSRSGSGDRRFHDAGWPFGRTAVQRYRHGGAREDRDRLERLGFFEAETIRPRQWWGDVRFVPAQAITT